MDQPKKPARDITDLKARLGLAKPGAAPIPPPGAPMASPGSAPTLSQSASSWQPSVAAPMAPPGMAPPPAAPVHDPYLALKPSAGRTFDLGPVDDGKPVASVRQKGGTGRMVVSAILLIIGLVVGGGFGGAAIGRRAFNNANFAAKLIQKELDDITKRVSSVNDAVLRSAQRSAKAGDPLAYDAAFVEEVAQVDLTKRPTTTRIFKADYFRLEDNLLDRLMNYYYDAVALYREVEEHVKKTTNDKAALEGVAKKTAEQKQGVNYGVVYVSTGNLLVGNLVEVGSPVCKGGGADCSADKIESFEVRASAGATWAPRPVGLKADVKNVVPIKPTELFDAVMNGSPEQVLMAQYRERVQTIRTLVARLAQTQKELVDTVNKAASRPDLFSPF